MNNEQPWIESVIPHELLDSKLFKFEITLPSVFQSVCSRCNLLYNSVVTSCQTCNQSDQLTQVHKKITVNMVPDVQLDYDNVEQCLEKIPSQLAYWSAVYAEARLRANYLERAAKTMRGKIYREITEAQNREKVKLPQEVVKQIAEDDERIVKIENELHYANMQSTKLYYMVTTLQSKADLARTLTSLKKEELNRV